MVIDAELVGRLQPWTMDTLGMTPTVACPACDYVNWFFDFEMPDFEHGDMVTCQCGETLSVQCGGDNDDATKSVD